MYVVVGGSGLIGPALVRQLRAQTGEERVFDPAPVPDAEVESVSGDARDAEAVARGIHGDESPPYPTSHISFYGETKATADAMVLRADSKGEPQNHTGGATRRGR